VVEALRTEPTVLVVEDVHWADEATLDWLVHLGRRLAELPVLLVLTFRRRGSWCRPAPSTTTWRPCWPGSAWTPAARRAAAPPTWASFRR
jgi:hypothetical protein